MSRLSREEGRQRSEAETLLRLYLKGADGGKGDGRGWGHRISSSSHSTIGTQVRTRTVLSGPPVVKGRLGATNGTSHLRRQDYHKSVTLVHDVKGFSPPTGGLFGSFRHDCLKTSDKPVETNTTSNFISSHLGLRETDKGSRTLVLSRLLVRVRIQSLRRSPSSKSGPY